MSGPMEKPMKDNGRRTKCTGMVCLCGRTAKSTKVTLSMIRGKDKASLSGRMAESMMECGRTASSTVEENSSLRMELKEAENGKMERKSNG